MYTHETKMQEFIVAMNRTSSRIGSFVAGLGALVTLWPSLPPLRYPHRSELDALRGDAVRIGRDMQTVIDREHARIQAKS